MRLLRATDSSCKGQALTELLVLLPVILLLLVAASDVGKLFVISGKAEIAARYTTLRWYRHAPFEPVGTEYPEPDPSDPTTLAVQLQQIFYAGSLDDDDGALDLAYREMQSGVLGSDFQYNPPLFDIPYWNAMIGLFNMGGEVLPVNADRVTFAYHIPYFPYGRSHPLKSTLKTGPPFWVADQDPLGPYSLFTAKGDFVTIAEAFDQDGGDAFVAILGQYGLILSIPPAVLLDTLAFVFWLLLVLWGGG